MEFMHLSQVSSGSLWALPSMQNTNEYDTSTVVTCTNIVSISLSLATLPQLCAAVLLVGPALADVGTNQYLPPTNQGYDYMKPPQSFPPAGRPSYPQPPRTPSYNPNPQQTTEVRSISR